MKVFSSWYNTGSQTNLTGETQPKDEEPKAPNNINNNNLNEQNRPVGKSRDRMDFFLAHRVKVNYNRYEDSELKANRLQQLELKLTSETQGRKIALFGKDSVPIVGEPSVEFTSQTACNNCKSSFGWFSKNKYQCPLCGNATCSDCFASSLSINGLSNQTRQVTVCKSCYQAVTFSHSVERRKKEIEASAKDPLVLAATLLHKFRTTIDEQLPILTSAILEAGEEHTDQNHNVIKKGLQADKIVGESFEKMSKVLKQLEQVPLETQKQAHLKKNIRESFMVFLQDVLPKFRLYNRQIETVAKLPMKKTSDAPKPTPAKAPVEARGQPTISGLDPCFVDQAPIAIKITGTNFSQRAKVLIDTEYVPVKFISSTELSVTAPALKEPGFKTVKVISSEGLVAQVENVLLYAQLAPQQSKTSQPPPTSSPKKALPQSDSSGFRKSTRSFGQRQ